MQLVLASGSPRRAELLRAAGFTFEVRAVDVDETIRPGESAEAYVRRLAMEKSAAALAVGPAEAGPHRNLAPAEAGDHGPAQAGHYEHTVFVLGADTAVVVDNEILGKPADERDAERMLRLLSGRRHIVMTGVSLRAGALELGRVETTGVWFAALTADEIAWYVASGEGRDKAGAYAIQGLASRFVQRVEGSYSNVVGLPVAAVHEMMHLASARQWSYPDMDLSRKSL